MEVNSSWRGRGRQYCAPQVGVFLIELLFQKHTEN